jgi:hypothetical protein
LVKPTFGTVTKVLAGIFVLSGVGAAYPALADSDGSNRIIFGVLVVAFSVIGAGLWLESVWAWWAGFAVTAVTVVMSLVLKAPDGGGFVWPAVLIVWIASAIQTWRSRSHA